MKKLLAVLGACCITASGASGVVACDVQNPGLNLYNLYSNNNETKDIMAAINAQITKDKGAGWTFNKFVDEFCKDIAKAPNFVKKFSNVTADQIKSDLSFKFYSNPGSNNKLSFLDKEDKDGTQPNLVTDFKSSIGIDTWYYLKLGGSVSGAKYFCDGMNSGIYIGDYGMDSSLRMIDSNNAAVKAQLAALTGINLKTKVSDLFATVLQAINKAMEKVQNWDSSKLQMNNFTIVFLNGYISTFNKNISTYDGGVDDKHINADAIPVPVFVDDKDKSLSDAGVLAGPDGNLHFALTNNGVAGNRIVSSTTSYFTGCNTTGKSDQLFSISIAK